MVSITALGFTIAVLACRNLAAPHDAPCNATQVPDIQVQHHRRSLLPPDSVPHALFKALGTVSGRPLLPGVVYIRDIVIVSFKPGTTAA